MSEHRKLTFTPARLKHLLVLVLLNIAGVAIGIDRVADSQDGRCPPCIGLATISENFDSVTPPTLPAGWLATNVGPLPLWVTSDIGLPSPPADTPPNAASLMIRLWSAINGSIRHPSLSLKDLDRSYHSGTTSILKPPISIPMWASTAACWSSVPTAGIPFKRFPAPPF